MSRHSATTLDARAGRGLRPHPRRALSLAYRAAQRVIVCDISKLLVLDRADLQPLAPQPEFQFRFLSTDDVQRFADEPENGLSKDFIARMQSGYDLCYAALSGPKLLAYAWLAIGSIEAEHNRGRARRSGVAVSFPPTAVFVYKAYTRPEARGHRLYASILARVLDELTARDVNQLVTTAEWTNRAALAACLRIGFREIGRVSRFGCGPLTFTRIPPHARQFGLQLGNEAVVASRSALSIESPSQANR